MNTKTRGQEKFLKYTRRSFVKTCAAAGFAGTFSIVRHAEAAAGDVYPGWNPGELDLHFVYTGCGENMFYRLPDGTAILNDTGDYYRPYDLENVPLLPSPERLGGEWMSRYVQRVYPEKLIDYLIFSHWHVDHIGHARFNHKETPESAFRFKTLADGTRINGFLCVAQDFGFRHYFDHQYPRHGMYKTHDASMALVESWMGKQREKGLICEPFQVGALNQISLQRDPGKFANFSIRNICANGCLWDGKNGVRDHAAEYVARTGNERIPQNTLSLGFVMQYGKFRFWAGGDTQNIPPSKNDKGLAYEDMVGQRVGPVTLCKMNHHGCGDAMGEGFVGAVRAKIYVSCVWSHWHVRESTMKRLVSRKLHPDFDPIVIPNFMPGNRAREYAGRPFMRNIPAETRNGVHVVVKVMPGGDDWKIYLLDARDESMRVVRTISGRA